MQHSIETRRAQAAYARTVKDHPDDQALIDEARRVWAELLAADLRRKADALEAAR